MGCVEIFDEIWSQDQGSFESFTVPDHLTCLSFVAFLIHGHQDLNQNYFKS